ncbi:MAG: D-sedoheptulose 7-phosphate isomerase [Bacteroidetes bacterium]|nr:D-sedoheptulose 7-phosphate isomerase [Bacteroidota bacterium]
MNRISEHFSQALTVLHEFSTEENFGKIEEAGKIMVEALMTSGKIISCGNGGSMCDAMHFAEELSGRYRNDRPALGAISLSDVSHMSCVANDYGYEQVFSRGVEALGRKGDVLLAISTSGNSANIIKAIVRAKELGIKVIGLTGKDGGKMADLCNVEIRAPKTEFADRAQEIHIKIIHSLIDYIELNL